MSSLFDRPITLGQSATPYDPPVDVRTRCPDLLAFIAIFFDTMISWKGAELHPAVTNAYPDFSDVIMGGASFDVRLVKTTSLPGALSDDDLFKGRHSVVVKHPKHDATEIPRSILSELATELQILRHPPLRKHDNIVDFLAVMYHDGGEQPVSSILPALVLEYAEYGNVSDYQANGYGRSIRDKVMILSDAAKGLDALHTCGIIHGDVKASNLLVVKHSTRGFIVKLSDFGFSLSQREDSRLIGFTQSLAAPEANSPLDKRFMRQLDMYPYGLLFSTVMMNGHSFLQYVDIGHDPDENIARLNAQHLVRMKAGNDVTVLAQVNLLKFMKGQRCELFIFCKILAYALQSDPQRRFGSMSTIVSLLNLARPLWNRPPIVDTQPKPLTPSFHAFLCKSKAEWMEKQTIAYFESFPEDWMPMKEVLEKMFLSRAEDATSVYLKTPDAWDSAAALLQVSLEIDRDLIGLYPEHQTQGTPRAGPGSISNTARCVLLFVPTFDNGAESGLRLDNSDDDNRVLKFSTNDMPHVGLLKSCGSMRADSIEKVAQHVYTPQRFPFGYSRDRNNIYSKHI